jgi:predicted nucleic-acid-binding protein
MLALDTNVLVRYVVGDGAREFARAVDIIENNRVSIALTVVLETEWVLRDVYEYQRSEIISAFEKFFGLPTVSVPELAVVRTAMKLAGSGLDFADAIHLAQIGAQDTFVTFDKALVKRASRHAGLSVRLA